MKLGKILNLWVLNLILGLKVQELMWICLSAHVIFLFFFIFISYLLTKKSYAYHFNLQISPPICTFLYRVFSPQIHISNITTKNLENFQEPESLCLLKNSLQK